MILMDNLYAQKIIKIFPTLKNNELYSNILIDVDSFRYISSKEDAQVITQIICTHLNEIHKSQLHCCILDYTAGCGGNILSFCNSLKKVVGIEINEHRCEFLKNNLKLYQINNAQIINTDAKIYNDTKMMELNPDVIFIDPPWGNNWNKKNINHRVSFSSYDIFENFVIDIFLKFEIEYRFNKYVVLKLPKNYDIEFLYSTITKYNYKYSIINIYLYIMNKMLILVLENVFIPSNNT
jgi:16S rRNA G966 N2-methylase RsmD